MISSSAISRIRAGLGNRSKTRNFMRAFCDDHRTSAVRGNHAREIHGPYGKSSATALYCSPTSPGNTLNGCLLCEYLVQQSRSLRSINHVGCPSALIATNRPVGCVSRHLEPQAYPTSKNVRPTPTIAPSRSPSECLRALDSCIIQSNRTNPNRAKQFWRSY